MNPEPSQRSWNKGSGIGLSFHGSRRDQLLGLTALSAHRDARGTRWTGMWGPSQGAAGTP